LEVDAEPGYSAGIHIHVEQPLTIHARSEAFYVFLQWEPILKQLAAGRFDAMRQFNEDVRGCLHYVVSAREWASVWDLTDETNQHFDWSSNNFEWPKLFEAIRTANEEDAKAIKRYLMNWHQDNSDRHTNLCTSTRFDTWEFRLWNSTRSAWRMELFARLSLAFVNANFISLIKDHDFSETEVPAETLVTALETLTWDRAAELLQRQIAYSQKIATGELIVNQAEFQQ
jgi:hypothetical protein